MRGVADEEALRRLVVSDDEESETENGEPGTSLAPVSLLTPDRLICRRGWRRQG